nr:hypothetical protein [Tanacetum cinerariifolium]
WCDGVDDDVDGVTVWRWDGVGGGRWLDVWPDVSSEREEAAESLYVREGDERMWVQADYPTDGGDSDDEPSDDDNDDDTDDEEPFEKDDEEEVEHPAPADSPAVPIVDLVLSAGEIEALEVDEPTHAPGSPISVPLSQTCLRKARKTVRPEPPMSASMKACIARHVALPLPPLHVPSLPLPLPSPLTTSPTNTGAPLGYRAAGIRMRALLPSTSHRTDIPRLICCLRRGLALLLSLLDSRLGRVLQLVLQGNQDLRCLTLGDARSSAIAGHVRTLETHVAALITQTASLQTQLTTTLGLIEVLEAKDPEPQEGPAKAGSSC